MTANENQVPEGSGLDSSSQQGAPAAANVEAQDVTIVGIGASAGGLETLEVFFEHVPTDAGVCFVVITHQHPDHTSLLPELLARRSKLPVVEAAHGMQLEANHVYVGPPGGQVSIRENRLVVIRHTKSTYRKLDLPIDFFFRSLAAQRREQAICIILSGTGSDGTLGLRAIKEEAGMAMVQEPHLAKFAGMPTSAIATGLVDYVLPVAELPDQLLRYVRGAFHQPRVASGRDQILAETLQKILALLRVRTGHDFTGYKVTTIQRRIQRRMNVHHLDQPEQYVDLLQENPHELDSLFRELLICVTSFFRDGTAYEALASGPLLALLTTRSERDKLRVWVPGCATGEAVYSLAILLQECMDKLNKRFEVQIFGTDLDPHSVETARQGRYPDGISADVSAARLERFFVREEGSYLISKEIREMAVFAQQNVIQDPPFTKLDLLSCRNLLIYLDTELQQRILPLFHYALKPDGLLYLGPSESIGQNSELFEVVDKQAKIFRRSSTNLANYALPHLPATSRSDQKPSREPLSDSRPQPNLSGLIEHRLLDRFCPACVVADQRGNIVHVQGRTGNFLELAGGRARTNLLDMARPGLPHPLASLMRQAVNAKQPVTRRNVPIKTNGTTLLIDLTVERILDPEPIQGLLLVSFHPLPQSEEDAQSHPGGDGSHDVEHGNSIEQELEFLRELHRTALEELETSNEELKSTNEELQSTNEELQSSNEELETSKEEMQSLNEELNTVNSELNSKLEDLSQSNDDMQNLLNSTRIATIFMDMNMNVLRFTEQATQLIKLRDSDVGRPLHELASNLKETSIADDCRDVLKTLKPQDKEVQSIQGGWYLMRILPYRTAENIVAGLVMTFVDIDQLKRGRDTVAYLSSIFDTMREPLAILDHEMRLATCNHAFYRLFQTDESSCRGQLFMDLPTARWDTPKLRRLLEELLPNQTTIEDFKFTAEIASLGTCHFTLNARRLERESGLPEMILLAFERVVEP